MHILQPRVGHLTAQRWRGLQAHTCVCVHHRVLWKGLHLPFM